MKNRLSRFRRHRARIRRIIDRHAAANLRLGIWTGRDRAASYFAGWAAGKAGADPGRRGTALGGSIVYVVDFARGFADGASGSDPDFGSWRRGR